MSKVRRPDPFLYAFGQYFWSLPKVRKMGVKYHKEELKGIKPPILVLANHTSHKDLHVVGNALIPYRCNFVGAINNRIGRKKLFDKLGVLTKRQFTASMQLVRDIKALFDKKGVVIMYPEARLSADGRLSGIPQSVAKLIKLCNVNTVAVRNEGVYLHHNKCTLSERKIPLSCTVKLIAKKEEIAALSKEEIYSRLISALDYDDFKYAKENNLKVSNPMFCMDKILYQCPVCEKEFTITSDDSSLRCAACSALFSADDFGGLSCQNSDIDSVAKWYDFQREYIKNNLTKDYSYTALCDISVYTDEGFKEMGGGALIHNFEGFTLKLAERELFFDGRHLNALSFDPASCIYLSNDEETYKVQIKENPRMAVKLALTQEEIFKARGGKE